MRPRVGNRSSLRRSTDTLRRYNGSRRDALRILGTTISALGIGGVVAGGFGTAMATIIGSPATAGESLDAHILQTASSLEILLGNAYRAAHDLPFLASGQNSVLSAFIEIASSQHEQHRQRFQTDTQALGANPQVSPDPKYSATLRAAGPNLHETGDLISLVLMLEDVVTQTYVSNIALLSDSHSRSVMAKVAGVEGQHVAVLRLFGGFLDQKIPELLNDSSGSRLDTLPATIPTVGVPEPFARLESASPPEEGAAP